MDMWINLIISLLSGAAGGNIAGSLSKDKGLGTAGNSVTGLLGGGIGGYILQLLGLFGAAGVTGATGAAPDVSNLDLTQILGNIGGSGIGGALLTLLVTFIKNTMNK